MTSLEALGSSPKSHISSRPTHTYFPPDNSYTAYQAKSTARAIHYFESALIALVPADRLEDNFCRGSRPSSSNSKGKVMNECTTLVERRVTMLR